jgi:hypothetical protein
VHLGLFGHLAVFTALTVNLWLGGDFVEAWAGSGARHLAELLLLLGYFWLVLGPVWFPRNRPAEGDRAPRDDEG